MVDFTKELSKEEIDKLSPAEYEEYNNLFKVREIVQKRKTREETQKRHMKLRIAKLKLVRAKQRQDFQNYIKKHGNREKWNKRQAKRNHEGRAYLGAQTVVRLKEMALAKNFERTYEVVNFLIDFYEKNKEKANDQKPD